MTARYEVGERVDVLLRNARVAAADSTSVTVETVDMEKIRLNLAAVTVTRVAPKEWPPQMGDVWEDAASDQWFARTHPDIDDVGLSSTDGRRISDWDAGTILEAHGPMRLAYRRGWSPKPEPAGPPAAPAAEPTDAEKRTAKIAGLRELTDWLDANPDVPLPWWTGVDVTIIVNNLDGVERTDAAWLAELHRIAGIIGEPVNADKAHPDARRAFSGDVAYRAFFIPKDEPTDIPGAGEEVAGPVVGAGSATAPTETAAGVAAPADGAPDLSATPAAVPAPVDGGDGAAVTPDVWVARRRSGAHYHGFHGLGTPGVYTACGRAARPNGNRIPLAEAVAFGAVPCPRCYTVSEG